MKTTFQRDLPKTWSRKGVIEIITTEEASETPEQHTEKFNALVERVKAAIPEPTAQPETPPAQ